jgi:short-subunit dehydrogenase
MEVRDARVLLTGASGGIGPTIARGLAQRGARLVLSGRRVDALEALAAELGAAEVLPADLADRAGPGTLARDAGAVDVFVSNAALPADGQVDDYTPDQIDRALDVNLRAPIFLARALTPAMVQRGRGSVVLVASIGAIATTPGSALYSATKFGLRGFGLALRQDLHGTGVGVTVVHPSFIDEAGMFAESGVKLPPGAPTRSPRDVADAVVRAIERGPAEIMVAPILLRLGTHLAGIAPAPVAAVSRVMGSYKIQAQLAEAHRAKR